MTILLRVSGGAVSFLLSYFSLCEAGVGLSLLAPHWPHIHYVAHAAVELVARALQCLEVGFFFFFSQYNEHWKIIIDRGTEKRLKFRFRVFSLWFSAA